jgi:phospholipase C
VKYHGLFGAIVLGTLTCIACQSSTDSDTDSAGGAWETESPTDESKSTHLWVVDRGLDILRKHASEFPGAANTIAWLDDAQCKTNWQNGLLQADFLAPFNAGSDDLTVPNGEATTQIEAVEGSAEVAAANSTWMSHFYDPGSGKNYEGFANSSDLPDDPIAHPIFLQIKEQVEVNGPVPVEAKGAALYRLGRAQKLLKGTETPSDHPNEPKDLRGRGCYELGLALHYFTDITQPMHASNFAATDRPRLLHSNWEVYAETLQAKFVRPDWSAGPKGAIDEVVQSAAVTSKAHWSAGDASPGPLFKALLTAYSVGGTWDDAGASHSDTACGAAAAELSAAGFITLDLPKCWQKNPGVVKETASALGDAQELTARFLAVLSLPNHPN